MTGLPRIIAGRRCRGCDCRSGGRFRCNMAAGDCGDRFASASIVRSGPGQTRPRACGDRQLQRLPYGPGWPEFCRRTAGADALRNDLFVEYHARCRDRDRPMVGGSLPARDALRGQSRRPASLPDFSIRSLHEYIGPGRCGDLCVPDDAAAGERAGARQRAVLSARPSICDRGLEAAVPASRHV